MKQFVADRTGQTPTLVEVPNEKIPIYDSFADAEADLANLAENQIIATKDDGAGELLHTVDTVEAGVLNPVTSNAVAGSLSYSTTERLTGGVWIDGKPIYQKVVDVGILPNTTTTNVLHNIPNLGDIVDSKLVAKTAGGLRVTCNYGGTSLSYYINNTNIVITSSYDFSDYEGYAIIQYTKTTD